MSDRYVTFKILQGNRNERIDPKFTVKEIGNVTKEIGKYVKNNVEDIEYDKRTKLFTIYFDDDVNKSKAKKEVGIMSSEIMINGLRGNGYRDPTFYVEIKKWHLEKEEDDVDESIDIEKKDNFPSQVEDVVLPLIYTMNSRLPTKYKIDQVKLMKRGPQYQIVIGLGDSVELKTGNKKKSPVRMTPKKNKKTSVEKKKQNDDKELIYTIHMKIEKNNKKVYQQFHDHVNQLLKEQLGNTKYEISEVYDPTTIEITVKRGRKSAAKIDSEIREVYEELQDFGGGVSNIALSN